jgi:hypothetical protein
MINGYDFPEISYFLQGNVFTGSQGENFRYRIAKDGEDLKAGVWFEDLCFECCNVAAEESFDLSNDGLVKAIEWILSQKK